MTEPCRPGDIHRTIIRSYISFVNDGALRCQHQPASPHLPIVDQSPFKNKRSVARAPITSITTSGKPNVHPVTIGFPRLTNVLTRTPLSIYLSIYRSLSLLIENKYLTSRDLRKMTGDIRGNKWPRRLRSDVAVLKANDRVTLARDYMQTEIKPKKDMRAFRQAYIVQ